MPLPAESITPLATQVDGPEEVERLAERVREAWGLGLGPISDVVALLERHGVLPVEVEGHSERLDAFSTWADHRPLVFLAMGKGSASRRRFDAAHELGHLLMHVDVSPGDIALERQADAFASAFLLPRAAFAAECPPRLQELKRRWKVSLAAMVRRAYDLGIYSEATYRRGYMQLNQRGWRESEPAADPRGRHAPGRGWSLARRGGVGRPPAPARLRAVARDRLTGGADGAGKGGRPGCPHTGQGSQPRQGARAARSGALPSAFRRSTRTRFVRPSATHTAPDLAMTDVLPAAADRTPLQTLHASLRARRRPEDVAENVREALGGVLTAAESRLLEKAARGSLKRRIFGYTSMLEDFARPVGMNRQVARARELFETAYPLNEDLCSNPAAVEEFIRTVGAEVGKTFGASDFWLHRLSRPERVERGMEISRRGYNKRFRLLARMEAKLHTLLREIRKREFQMIGKSGLASRLSWEDFSADVDSACFIAYYTARRNLRSEFTVSGQQKAYDEVAEMLFARCRRSGTASWWAIAHAFPRVDVFRHLSEREAGELLGGWFATLQEIGALLEEVWGRSGIDRETMVVRRGNDSSTWNNTAAAWNMARDNWIGLLYALGLEDMLDRFVPGKVMRLIAGDVAFWHSLVGTQKEPNTQVWNELPLPWEVLSGVAACTRPMVEEACRRHGLDPLKSGWMAPRPAGRPARFRPTPELVHGVAVANPYLADFLRKLGYFSGKVKDAVDASV